MITISRKITAMNKYNVDVLGNEHVLSQERFTDAFSL